MAKLRKGLYAQISEQFLQEKNVKKSIECAIIDKVESDDQQCSDVEIYFKDGTMQTLAIPHQYIKTQATVTKYLSQTKMIQLEESISWLSNYKYNPDEENVKNAIGSASEGIDEEATKLLTELGQLNMRRQDILKKLLKQD